MKLIQKLVSGCLAALILLSMLPVQTFAEEVITVETPPEVVTDAEPADTQACTSVETMTAEEQYEAYAIQTFYEKEDASYGVEGGNRLTGIERQLYDALVPILREIANGQRSSSVIRIGQDVNYQGEVYPADVQATFDEYTFDLGVLHHALLGDLPYELYWYDKTSGVQTTRWTRGFELVQVEFYFNVADNYQGAEEYTTNTAKTGAASRSAANAKSIVSKYAGVSDYDKLVGYKNEIQDRVEYDHDAADGGYYDTYIDPWQLISVFDGDPSTNVVCEGYSKAYMYLCDMTAFTGNIICHTVSGELNGGAHMWNIVSIEGKHYLADVTNSDTGTVGENGGLFLNGVTGDPWEYYMTSVGVRFTYDYDMFLLWGEDEDSILFLESTDYDPTNAKVASPVVSKLENTAKGIKVTWGAVPGAVKYRVFVKTSSGWKTVGTTTDTSFLWTGAQSGKTYTFTVRCINEAEDTYTSSFNTIGWKKTFIAQANISKLENTDKGLKLTWGKVAGASKYRVYVKNADGGWTKITDTTSTSYTWTGAKSGKTYTFTVRCLDADGNGVSAYNNDGWKLKFVAQPAITKLQSTAKGVQITWGKISGASKYRVYVKNADGGWTKITDTTSTSYTWTGAKSGKTYTFTIRCLDADGNGVSAYNNDGWKLKFVAQPAITKLQNTADGLKLTWDAVAGASKYRVYVKNADGGWTKITDTSSTSYTWTGAKSGKTYTFTIRCLDANGNTVSAFNDTGWKKTFVAQPAITKLQNTDEGVKITWGKVAGAKQYRVYVQNADGGWTKLTDTSSTSFTWTGAKSGKTYVFTVRCMDSDGKTYTSAYSETGWKIKFVAQPKITKLESVASGVKITWGKISGASKYRVYVKSADGTWTKLTDTTSTSYTWTGAKAGTSYTFTVRCLDSKGNGVSAYNNDGWKHKYYPTPSFSGMESTSEGVKLTWKSVKGAQLYRVYVKKGDTWTKLTDTKSTSFTWTGAKPGQTYTFTIRCLASDGKTYVSNYSTTGWEHRYYPTPSFSGMESTANGVKLTWNAVNNAKIYRIYVKEGTSWKKLTDTSDTSYTWTGAKKGTTYFFTIRCIDSDGKTYTSNYNTTGWSHAYLAQPKVSSFESLSTGMKITWGKVSGAEKYRVYVKTEKGWSKVGDSTSNTFTWTGAKLGQSYTFTVRCLNAAGTAFTSAANGTGWSETFSPAPDITKLESVSGGVKITWGAINGAEKYRVFVKNADGGWTKVGDTTSTSLTWSGAKKGTTYTFTVRCLNADGTAFTSPYNPEGWSHKHN